MPSPRDPATHGMAVLHPDELVRSKALEFLAGIPPLPEDDPDVVAREQGPELKEYTNG